MKEAFIKCPTSSKEYLYSLDANGNAFSITPQVKNIVHNRAMNAMKNKIICGIALQISLIISLIVA